MAARVGRSTFRDCHRNYHVLRMYEQLRCELPAAHVRDCADFSYAQNTGTDAQQSEQKVTGSEGLSKRWASRINECDARAGRKLGNKFGRAIQFSGVAGVDANGHRRYRVPGVRRLGRLTFVARPPASSSTMAYHPKSICHSFQPRRADDGFA